MSIPVISSELSACILGNVTMPLTSDGVLDLDTGIDFDEVVSVLLVDQEFRGTSVTVLDSMGKLECVVQDSLSDVLVKMRGRSDFDNLS